MTRGAPSSGPHARPDARIEPDAAPAAPLPQVREDGRSERASAAPDAPAAPAAAAGAADGPGVSASTGSAGSADGAGDGDNVALLLRAWAERTPDAPAVLAPRRGADDGSGRWRVWSFARLAETAGRYARELAARGLRPGDRACVLVRPGPELVAAVYGLFQLGAVPVLVDPGMGRDRLLACVRRMHPRGLVGVPAALVARRLFPRAFRSVEVAWAPPRERDRARSASTPPSPRAAAPFPIEPGAPGREAAVLFTSGSTGPAKGAVYTHGNFRAQLAALDALYGFAPGEVDAACFPAFALFDAALGTAAAFPPLDPSRPARCDPERVVRAIEETGASFSFGSPAIWRRVAPWLARRGRRLERLARVLVAGAPVPPALAEALTGVLPDGARVHTPYGATEALPVTSIDSEGIRAVRARTESGEGTCVGRPAPGVEVRLLRVDDGPVERWDDALEVPAGSGEAGEVCVRGAVVTSSYAEEPEATRLAKIAGDPGGRSGRSGPEGLWHRMGDVGRFDAEGRLWICGRKSHRVETSAGTVYPVPAENVWATHPAVRRCALVGTGERGGQEPVLVVEPEGRAGGRRRGALAREILAHGRERGAGIEPRCVLFRRSLPVDVRHNAKIHRVDLGRWAGRRIR